MQDFEVLEPAIDPNNRISFLLDWELTLKCNLDCSYCGTGLHGGHDNSTKHPPKEKCILALDFMFAYVDLYMNKKPKGIRYVVLNIYGGESLHHPDIVEIISQIQEKYQPYKDNWHLTVTTTTNAIISEKKLKKIIPYIDEFTVSYHPENSEKHKKLFKNNLLTIAKAGKRQKCIVMMDPKTFEDSQSMLRWLDTNKIQSLPKVIDYSTVYYQPQVKWFDKYFQEKTFGVLPTVENNVRDKDLPAHGRACCGGRQTCMDQKYSERHFYVPNQFTDWYCSVNHFFLFIKQVNGEIYVNKDCKMNFDGTVSPIGNLSDPDSILTTLKDQLDNNTMPVIQCKKSKCLCGLCAPKAKDLTVYKSMMKKYQRN
jgi:Radical SAM superfamily